MEGLHGHGYRPDIDGLRALAVAAVVLHHLNAELMPGGYLGVDIFFVISGFLIGGLLLDEARSGRIDIVHFYHRRILRIIPAYAAMMLAAYVAAVAVLAPRPLLFFSGAAANALVFLSNFYFARNADYFDATTTQNPLLHTWSLSVEEQFYVAFPLLLIGLIRLGAKSLGPALVILFLLAAAGTAFVTNVQAGYFWPHTRAVELLTGVLVAAFPALGLRWKPAREISNVLAMAILTVTFVTFNDQQAIPHLWPLIPCFACAVLLANGRQGSSVIGKTLALKPVVALGLVSYSLYLIHWPIIVYTRALGFDTEALDVGSAVVALSLVLAVLSWRFVERPFRWRRNLGPRYSFRLLAATTTALLLAFVPIAVTRGLPRRFSPEVQAILSDEWKNSSLHACMGKAVDLNFGWRERTRRDSICFLGNREKAISTVLWGDSLATSLAPGVDEALTDVGSSGVLYAKAGCALALDWSSPPFKSQDCGDFNRRTLTDILASDAKVVILHARWLAWVEGALGQQALMLPKPSPQKKARVLETLEARLQPLIATLHRSGKRVLLIGAPPDVGFDVRYALGTALQWERPMPRGLDISTVRDRQEAVTAVLQKSIGANDRYIDLVDILCGPSECPITDGSAPLYNDSFHMSDANAHRAAGTIAERLRDLLKESASGKAERL